MENKLRALFFALLGLLTACALPDPTVRQVASFLEQYTFPGETIAGPDSMRLSNRTQHPTINLPAGDVPAEWETISRTHPDYLVVPQGTLWELLNHKPWFRTHYRRVAQFTTSRLAPPAILVYAARPIPDDLGTWHQAETHLATPDGGEFTLLHYRAADRPLTNGGDYHVTLVWQVTRPLPTSPAITLYLADGSGKHWAQQTTLPSSLRGETWPTGITMTTHHTLHLPDILPNGAYTLQLAFTPPLRIIDAPQPVTPLPLSHLEHLPDIRLAPPPQPQHPLTATFGSAIALLGYDAPARVSVSGTLPLTLYWQSLAPLAVDYKIFVHLLTPQGNLVAQEDAVPVRWTYPTGLWQAGEFIRDPYLLDLTTVPRGDILLTVGFYDPHSGERLPVHGSGADTAARRLILTEVAVR